MRLAMVTVLATATAAFLIAAGCKKEDQAQDPNVPQGAYPQNTYPGAYPQNTYPGAYPQNTYPQGGYTAPPQQTYPPAATTAPAAAPPPAGGLPCQTDNDPQCPFGHCVSGTCGACSAPEHCKAGSTCMQTPLGGRCLPGGATTQ